MSVAGRFSPSAFGCPPGLTLVFVSPQLFLFCAPFVLSVIVSFLLCVSFFKCAV